MEKQYPKIYGFRTPEKHMFDPPEHWARVEEQFKKERTMKIVEFYRGERPNHMGVTLDEMMQFTHGQLEMDHDYVQWMFPSNEASMLNVEAPVLTKEEAYIISSDPELREKVKQSFIKMLDFFGFVLTKDEEGSVLIEDMPPTEKRKQPQRWLMSFNHNMLRATRVLKCLRLCGLTEHALAFYNALRNHKVKVSTNTFKYWTDAIMVPLW